jgi:hypothetical protein
MKEAGYEWDAEKKELRKIEKKPVWSDEDTFIINKILYICNYYEKSFEHSPLSRVSIKEDVNKIDNWLKFLKDRVQPKQEWKPSEEQVKVLDIAIHCGIQLGSSEEIVLRSLLEQLKQL